MRENRIEKALTRVVKDRGGYCMKWVSPGRRGVPDRIVMMPGGRTMYIETKAPGKPLSPLQAKMINDLLSKGHIALKIDSLEEVERFARVVLDSAAKKNRGDA